ncbi:hypothetical protein O181_101743 [Austropuccinia psidii MF-1]|uniref:Uncharacterized protein n=1 Tax=Austropuccinia psidii MF-1 TaxID=1389203 RepID=A0A9Q3JF17_9BASI|nr:hypothetical protein [Austropuccinia psidii MF-1]
MVHTRNGRNYSVQPDGCRPSPEVASIPQERHIWRMLELPPFPRSACTNFDVNSESELIHDSISSAEPISSAGNKYLPMPIQELVREAKEEEWEIC